jgi:uncharacterized membrane protein
MMIGMGLFWIAVVVGLVWVVRTAVGEREHPREETALSILDRRFAEGAVPFDEYHRRRAVLDGSAEPGVR